MIELGDGSMGMLPEEWLKKYGMLADLGTSENGASGSRHRKPACSMLCWPTSPKSRSTPPSRKYASTCANSRVSSRSTRPWLSW